VKDVCIDKSPNILPEKIEIRKKKRDGLKTLEKEIKDHEGGEESDERLV
jgi:hypothetical protein